jgi:hypothetical protein
MPWKECDRMEEKPRFVAKVLEGEKTAGIVHTDIRTNWRSRSKRTSCASSEGTRHGVHPSCAIGTGVLVAEAGQPYLDLKMDSPYEQLAGAAICYAIAAAPQTGAAPQGSFGEKPRIIYSGRPALHAAGQPSAAQNRSRRFCFAQCA